MKKAVSLILAVVLSLSCFTIGIIEIGKEIADKIEYKQIEKLYCEVTALTGKIENRVVVNCKRKLDPMGAVQTASGYDNIQIFQYANREQAEKALKYYSSLNYVDNVEFDTRVMPKEDSILVNDDAKCFATATSNIDDMIKLINENYSDLPEIKIAVIDSGCEENALTRDRVVNLGNTVGADNDHGTKICGTIIYNTLPNVKIYSYDVGDADGFSSAGCTTAMTRARSQGCKVFNMSYGAYETSINEQNTVNNCYNAGVIMVAAAGNEKTKLTSSVKHYPSCYDKVFGIGALDPDRCKSSFSNYGTGVNYYTVGNNVRSFQNGEDIYWRGTSAATPIAVSIITNLLIVNPSLTFSQIKSTMSTNTSHDDSTSYPYMNGYKALCNLTGKSLPQAGFTYDLDSNKETGLCEITFHCDAGVRIYCNKSPSELAVNNSKWSLGCYGDGDTLSFDNSTTINAVAYGDGMSKSTEKVISASKANGEGYLYDAESAELSYCQYYNSEVIEVPSTFNGNAVTSLGDAAFAGNTAVETIVLPKSITKVGAYAFANCPNLKKVIAPGVEKLGRYAFENCENLLFAYFPKAAKVFNCALFNCKNLTAIDIGSLNTSDSLNITFSAFAKSDNIISWNKKRHKYAISSVSNDGSFTYQCTKCTTTETVDLSADALHKMWSPYLVGRVINTTDYDSLFLFDVTGDGVINAKDYSVLNKACKNTF